MKWDITKYFENKYTIETQQKKINALNKNRIFSNWKRILNFTLIFNLGMWLVLCMQPINPFVLGMSFILSNCNTKLIPITLYYFTHKLTSFMGGFALNNLYNKLFAQRKLRKIFKPEFKLENELQLAKENIIHNVDLEKLIIRDEIYTNVINSLYNNHVITDIGVALSNPIDDKIEDKCKELDYLTTKRVLVENYKDFYDLYYHDKLRKKLRLLTAINNGFLYSFLTTFLNQNIISSILNLLITTVIFDSKIEKHILDRIDNLRDDALAEALEELQNKLGEFYIPKDPRLLIKEYASLSEKIFGLEKEIHQSYYQYYESIFKPDNGDATISKDNLPSKGIAPINRELDPIPTHNNTRVLKP